MKNLGRIGGLAVLLAAAVSVAAVPQDEGKRGGPGRGHRMQRHFEGVSTYLGLTEEQQSQWKAAHEQLRSTVEPLMKEGHALRDKMRSALDAPKPDPTAVGKLAIAEHDVHKRIRAGHEAVETQLTASLTPEQKTRYDAFKAARGMGRRPFGHHGPGMRDHMPAPPHDESDGPDEGQQ